MPKREKPAPPAEPEPTEAAEDNAASEESEPDKVVCGRCGHTFSDQQLEEGFSCTHRQCPMR